MRNIYHFFYLKLYQKVHYEHFEMNKLYFPTLFIFITS